MVVFKIRMEFNEEVCHMHFKGKGYNNKRLLSLEDFECLAADENLLSADDPKSKLWPLTSKAYSIRPVWEAVGAAEP